MFHFLFSFDYRLLYVLLGSDYSWYDSSSTRGVLTSIWQKHEHKEWNNVTGEWDAAVLILSTRVAESDRIKVRISDIKYNKIYIHVSHWQTKNQAEIKVFL